MALVKTNPVDQQHLPSSGWDGASGGGRLGNLHPIQQQRERGRSPQYGVRVKRCVQLHPRIHLQNYAIGVCGRCPVGQRNFAGRAGMEAACHLMVRAPQVRAREAGKGVVRRAACANGRKRRARYKRKVAIRLRGCAAHVTSSVLGALLAGAAGQGGAVARELVKQQRYAGAVEDNVVRALHDAVRAMRHVSAVN